MIILRIRVRNAEEFRSLYQADLPRGGLFCATTRELTAGMPVVVEIVCKVLPNRVLIRGEVVSWRPALPRLRVRAGAIVSFAEDEGQKRDFVLDTMGGQRVPTPRRKHARLPVGMPVRLRVAAEPRVHNAELREISVSGALVSAEVQPPLGADVVLEIVPPGAMAAMDVSGRVLYHAGPSQTGVKFLFREGGGSRRLRELVRRFKTS